MKHFLFFTLLGWFAAVARSAAAEGTIVISNTVDSLGFLPPVPINVTGFSGEVESVLKNDLFFMGFKFESSKPRYELKGSNNGRVEARLTDTLAQKTLLAKAYTGGTPRQQTHVLADEVAKIATGLPGIAQTRIAYCAQAKSGGAGEVYVADYDGYNSSPVTQDAVLVGSPAWAGPGQLLYTSYKLGNSRIFSQNLATGDRQVIANYNGLCDGAAVSPDGTRVAMILSKSGTVDLYVSDLNGGNLQRLTTSADEESSPCWSPDGQTICFVRRTANRPALYTILASGGEPSRIAGMFNPSEPDWSPDGRFLIFTATTGGGFQLYLLPMTGPQKGTARPLVAGKNASWAPNSRAVIFTRTVNHRGVLSLLDVPRTETKDINKISGSASQPSWAR